jgi:Leucine-rich repeat (LRR) protein
MGIKLAINCFKKTFFNGEEEKELKEETFDFSQDIKLFRCPECNNLPTIEKIHTDNGIFELKCKCETDGKIKKIKKNINEYYEEAKEDNIDIRENEVEYYYCENCNQAINNERVLNDAHKNHKIKDFSFYCLNCQKYLYERGEGHEKHEIKDLSNLRNELEKKYMDLIKEKNEELAKMIRFNQVFYNTYEKFPNNYYHIRSAMNLGKSMDSEISRDSEQLSLLKEELEKKAEAQKNAIENLKKDIKAKREKRAETEKKEGQEIKIIKDVEINPREEKLELYNEDLEDQHFKCITQILFYKLRILDLSFNKIKDVSELKNMDLPYLEVFDMSNNDIVEIRPIAELNCIQLKEIYLQKNNIKNIEAFIDANFPNLTIFSIKKQKGNVLDQSLECNKKVIRKYHKEIIDIEMTYEEFNKKYETELVEGEDNIIIHGKDNGDKMLKDLYYLLSNHKNNRIKYLVLDDNKITDPSIVSRFPLPNLRMIDLSLNRIKNLRFLEKMNLKKIKLLFLNDNEIYDLFKINSLYEKGELNNIKALSLESNKFDKTIKENEKIDINSKDSNSEDEIYQNNLILLKTLKDKGVRLEKKFDFKEEINREEN